MSRWPLRMGWVAAGALAITLVAMLARDTLGGPLDPAGSPGSTMQRLSDIPGSWSRSLDSTNGDGAGCGSTRFECVLSVSVCDPTCHFEYRGVLDHETGLVWEIEPQYTSQNWFQALTTCRNATTGNRHGWRVPYIEEFMSLADVSLDGPALPSGHPFLNIADDVLYWSANTHTAPPDYEAVAFNADLGSWQLSGKLVDRQVWCVRGGAGIPAIAQP